VEAFFTAKGDTLYAILPAWPSRPVTLKDIHPSAQTIVAMLGWEKPLKWTPVEGGVAVEVPALSVDELPCAHAYTFKLTHVAGDQPR
jgi:alpha-L-fucosidase